MERDRHIHHRPLCTKNHMVEGESFGRRPRVVGAGMRAPVTDTEGAPKPTLVQDGRSTTTHCFLEANTLQTEQDSSRKSK